MNDLNIKQQNFFTTAAITLLMDLKRRYCLKYEENS